ncbi:hypothetical protein J2M53_15005 [Arthrobacter sp. zg-ZUI100]|uniref:hypothetical protein n=1 Tax=Arthrobacter jiangjiafuii TaxID=2817475 RepID=UPI001AEE72FE|nr:hypothetical protein [Arthrobacter jiangjiafuii]MBP3037536.1 hypothetical protein [Arthrobacter jiangjiafuii]MBP3037554.1 hypothetical protein [Arthrobacter jiangjiafuii]
MDAYTHPGSRRLAVVYIAAFALITVAALVVYYLYTWARVGYGAAVLVLILTLVMGPAMDGRLERVL